MNNDNKSFKSDEVKSECVSIDFPEWVRIKLDEKAYFAGVSPQDIVKLWVIERLDSYLE